MLVEQIKEAKENGQEVIQARGGCCFCGQIADINALPGWEKEQYNEIATELCTCSEAKAYSEEKKQKERAHERIDMLFSPQKTPAIRKGAVKYLYEGVDKILSNQLVKITLDMGSGIKAAMYLTGKNKLKIKRSIKTDSEMEA